MRKPKTGSQKLVEIMRGKQPRRPHYVDEWASKRGYTGTGAMARLAADLNADKSLVTRWYDGATPGTDYQEKLAALFGYPGEPEIIFRHPDDDWMARFLKDRPEQEIERIKKTLELTFPRRHLQGQ